MCRLWAAEAYNPCMPGPATTTLYGFIVSPFMSSPVGVGGQQFRKFTVYVSVSGAEIIRVLTCVCTHCMHVYPDQLVRAQPLKNQCVNTYVSVSQSLLAYIPSPTCSHFGGIIFFNDHGWNKLSNNSSLPFFMCPSLSHFPPSLFSLFPFFSTLPGGGVWLTDGNE